MTTSAKLMQTFDQDIREFVFGSLPTTPATRPELEAMGPAQLLAILGNWLQRFVEPAPRRVHMSAAFLANPYLVDPLYKSEIPLLVSKIAKGDPLRPHLSNRVRTPYEVRAPSKRKPLSLRRDVDLLLSDWGVHHLHLSSEPGKKGFLRRTDMLLMAVFTPGDAYLIDIMDHTSWSDDQIVGIIVREWPDAGLINKMHGAFGRETLSKEQRQHLRNNGTGASVVIDGAMYFGNGFMANGISIAATIQGNHVYRSLRSFADRVEADPSFVPGIVRQQGLVPPVVLDMHFGVGLDMWGVVERETGVFMRLVG